MTKNFSDSSSSGLAPQMTLALMDADKNGKVNADEIMAFFSKMGGASPVTDKTQAEAMIAAVDSDGDGELNEAGQDAKKSSSVCRNNSHKWTKVAS